MAFPNFEGKHAHDAFFSPHDTISYAYQHNLLPDFSLPPACRTTAGGLKPPLRQKKGVHRVS